MAMTATISVTPSTVKTEQKVTAILTVSNSAAYPVSLVDVNPLVRLTSSVASNYGSGVVVSKINMGPNTNMVVPAAGDLVLTFQVKFHGPSTASASNLYDDSGSNTFDVGANCKSDDGSSFSATAATVTVNYAVNF